MFNALNDMDQSDVRYDTGSRGVGLLVSDTLMFQRAEPMPSDPHFGQVYGLAMPLEAEAAGQFIGYQLKVGRFLQRDKLC